MMEPKNIPNIEYMEEDRPVVDINYQFNDSENTFSSNDDFKTNDDFVVNSNKEVPAFENNEFEFKPFEDFNKNVDIPKFEDKDEITNEQVETPEVKETKVTSDNHFDKLIDAVLLLESTAKNMNTTVENLCSTVKLVDSSAKNLGTTALQLFDTITKLGSEETFKKLVDEMK